MIPIQYALRRRMMISVNKGLPISDLSLGTLIRIADSDGIDGAGNYIGTPSYSFGVVPAFVLPSSLQVEADADVNGVYNLAL